jgi:GNAT superfamily N-acetyltransferase
MSHHRLAEAIEANLARYWLSLGTGPAGEVHDSKSIRWAYSGGPYFNRVVTAQLDEDKADGCIQTVISAFRRRRAAITWLTGPSSLPDDLGTRLEANGFSRYDDWTGMVHDLTNLDPPDSARADIEIRQVSDDVSHHQWIDVVCRSFALPRRACRTLDEYFSHPSSKDSSAWHRSVGYQDGSPVAATTLFVHDGVAGIYLVSTVPGFRGKGFGSAMTLAALRQARDLGCSMAVLQATATAEQMYTRLGFQPVCKFGIYRYAATRPFYQRVLAALVRRARNLRRFRKGRFRHTTLRPDEAHSTPAQREQMFGSSISR